MKTINLKQYKRDKDSKALAAKIATDLEAVVLLCDTSIRGLSLFNKYTQVMEIISCMQTNKTLVSIHLEKYKKLLEKEDEKN